MVAEIPIGAARWPVTEKRQDADVQLVSAAGGTAEEP